MPAARGIRRRAACRAARTVPARQWTPGVTRPVPGHVLYTWGDRILLTDPETGETAVLARVTAAVVRLTGTTSKGASILVFSGRGMNQRIARLAKGSMVLQYLGARVGSPIAAFADGSLLCIDGSNRLVRAHFGSDRVEVLWPR